MLLDSKLGGLWKRLLKQRYVNYRPQLIVILWRDLMLCVGLGSWDRSICEKRKRIKASLTRKLELLLNVDHYEDSLQEIEETKLHLN